ncbi:3-oxoacyl-[acyl-carrier-protein] synthase III C-terminal domain-containing protein [Fischerella thermalis]|uniref:3-oxoacyl-ACP synthase n=2 Tax=Fischerella TaxID=1190 RepID=A0A2N6LI10_9CYAN|nr:hypothetical protein [Fischerella sp. MV11]PMB23825.1 3-oxoacyl-ACP synthase [Fischerella thermalis CCMEE 5318]PMB32039.1 3-oxoacyl-ACP synthase [Fischerella thermalis CCMEE 5319]
MNWAVGIRSLAVSFPSVIRTNDYWCKKFPELIQQEKPRTARLSRSRVSTFSKNDLDIWSQEVAPYLNDPFRGNVERRVLGEGESSLTLEYRAAKDALHTAKLSPQKVELMIVASLFPKQIGLGNACYLAQKLELQCPAWNLESSCSSALVALHNAHALVQTGAYSNVLVVVSHIGSNTVDEEDTLSWSMGDAAGAFIVGLLKPNQGILSTKIINTAATCGAYLYELTTDTQGNPRIRTRTGENASMLAETAVNFVQTCCKDAIATAGVTLEQIDFFAFNTPTAWYASVCTQALGIDPERTINLYPQYANIGPVIPIANLYHAVLAGKIRENDLVLVYTNGAASTAAATVMRWGDVTLGTPPASPISVTQQQQKEHQKQKSSFLGKINGLSKAKLLMQEPEERQRIVEAYLLEWLSHTLQIPLAQLHPEQLLNSYLDSLIALMLKSQIESDLEVRVPMEKFFGEQNIVQLAELLLNQLVLANLIASESVCVDDSHQEQKREKLSF